jgi:alkylation response protein AidB-like acyl-CoA dehydrogenase
MGHFKSNLRDIEFNLFELLDRQELLGAEPFADVDEETARGILDEVRRLAEGPVAESFADADRNPPVFDPTTHSVTMPDSFKRSYQAFVDAEWFRLELPPELGGTTVPRTIAWSVAELVLGANPAVWMYSTLGSFSHALWLMGTPAQ